MPSIRSRGPRTEIKPAGRRVPPVPALPKPSSSLVREGIFGINDGLVATIGLVSGEALSHQGHASILIAGLSAVGAATVSMAVGSYLATSSANDFIKKEIDDQERAIRQHPHRERHHVARLLGEIGVPPYAVADAAGSIVKSRTGWLSFMARENLGIHANRRETPLKNALVMGGAVIMGSTPPILPYLLPFSLILARDISWAVSVAAAMALGAAKGILTRTSQLKSALSFGVLVTLSALVGSLIGMGLSTLGA